MKFNRFEINIPMFYQLCLLLFSMGVFLYGLAKFISLWKP